MATSQATAIQVEGEMTVQAAIQQLVEIEVEEDKGDPFEGMNNAQIANIYHRIKPEDPRLLRQFKSFHKLYYNLHGHLQKHRSIHCPSTTKISFTTGQGKTSGPGTATATCRSGHY